MCQLDEGLKLVSAPNCQCVDAMVLIIGSLSPVLYGNDDGWTLNSDERQDTKVGSPEHRPSDVKVRVKT